MDSKSTNSEHEHRRVQSHEFRPGERLMLKVFEDEEAPGLLCARTKWVQKRGNDYVLGCEFIHQSGHNSLQPFIQKKRAEPAAEKIEKRDSRWVWLSASYVAMIWAFWQFGICEVATW